MTAISAGDLVTKQINHFFASATYFVQFQLATDGFKERLRNNARIHILNYFVAVMVTAVFIVLFPPFLGIFWIDFVGDRVHECD